MKRLDRNAPRGELEKGIYEYLAEKEPPLNDWQRSKLRELARNNVEAILFCQSIVTAQEDARMMKDPYGGDIDLFSPVLEDVKEHP